jgi:peptidoglycan/LPS O-acetylase OafA/YrhL
VGTGWVGVDLFFVLSGFLITTVLLDARAAENYYSVFYIRRALRIFPMYYLVLAAYLLVLRPSCCSAKMQLFYWLNLSNVPTAFDVRVPLLDHFWSLAVEEQFYLIWPLLVRRLRPRSLGCLCSGVVVGLFIVRNLPPVLALNARWPELIYRLTPFRVDTLCAGALIAIAVQRVPDLSRYRPHLRMACMISACAFLLAGFGKLFMAESVVRLGYTALVVCFTSLVALALFPGSLTARVSSNLLLRRTGRYSYCFYLVHPFLIAVAADHQTAIRRAQILLGLGAVSNNVIQLAVFVLEFGAIFAFSALSWRFFEGPILRLKRYVPYKPAPAHPLS